MEAAALDSFEKGSLVPQEYNYSDRMKEFNNLFKSKTTPENGVYGSQKENIGDSVAITASRNESGNLVKEYYVDGKQVGSVENNENSALKVSSVANSSVVNDILSNTKPIELPKTIEKGNFSAKLDSLDRPRINKISDLQVKETGRDPLNVSRTKAYKPGDQRGHLIADNLGGPASSENIVPQSKYANQTQFKSLEHKIAKLKTDNPGAKIDYEVKTNYIGKGERPSSFETKVTMNGKPVEELSQKIYNTKTDSSIRKAFKRLGEKIGSHHDVGKESGLIAAGVTCAMSTVDNVKACIEGEVSAGEAALNIVSDTGTAGAVGYGAGFVSSAVSSAMSKSSHALISRIGGSCLPAAAVSFGIASYDTVIDFAQGDISVEEFAYDMGENAVGVAGSIGGAVAAGAALGSIVPGAGTVVGAATGLVGGMVGYAVTTAAYETVVEAAGDAIDYCADHLEELSDKASEIATDIVESAAEFGEDVVDVVGDTVSDIGGTIADLWPF